MDRRAAARRPPAAEHPGQHPRSRAGACSLPPRGRGAAPGSCTWRGRASAPRSGAPGCPPRSLGEWALQWGEGRRVERAGAHGSCRGWGGPLRALPAAMRRGARPRTRRALAWLKVMLTYISISDARAAAPALRCSRRQPGMSHSSTPPGGRRAGGRWGYEFQSDRRDVRARKPPLRPSARPLARTSDPSAPAPRPPSRLAPTSDARPAANQGRPNPPKA